MGCLKYSKNLVDSLKGIYNIRSSRLKAFRWEQKRILKTISSVIEMKTQDEPSKKIISIDWGYTKQMFIIQGNKKIKKCF